MSGADRRRFKRRSAGEKRPVARGDEIMMMMIMMTVMMIMIIMIIIVISSNVKYTTYFKGEITLNVAQIINT